MKRIGNLKAGALSTVIVVSALMMLVVMALVSLWDMDMLLFSRTQYLKSQKADIESAYLLYSTHPDRFTQKETELTIFDDRPWSKVRVERDRWGLYELVSISVEKPAFTRTKLMGLREPCAYGTGFYHPENQMSITLAGNTNILTTAYLPRNGFIYGQMNSEFFDGKELESAQMKPADTLFPVAPQEILAGVDSIFSVQPFSRLSAGNISVPFFKSTPLILSAGGDIYNCNLAGKVIVVGDELTVDSTCRFSDIIIICSSLVVGKGFEGSMQVFARDSVVVGPNARLLSPSGIYASNRVRLSDNTQVNGYVIVNPLEEPEVTKPNYVSARKSVVRGFVYVDGNAQLQGIVSGSVFIKEAMYYAFSGYYRGMIHDFTLLENPGVAYPIWLDQGKRREAEWVK